MSKHLERDLDRLKKKILTMGAMVESAANKAINALVERRLQWAEEVMAGDDEIDSREVEIEEDCLKALALHQPVAADLRFIITVLKVNNDLERMGDLAVNIAERAAYLTTHDPIQVPVDFTRMIEIVRAMVRDSLDALVKQDAALARRVCHRDDEVDELNRNMYHLLQDLMAREPQAIKRAVHTLSACRHLERIGDLATNVAEDVVFMVEGEIVRHRLEKYTS